MVDGVTARNRTDNCCPCKYRETRLTRKGSDERAYRGPKNTQGEQRLRHRLAARGPNHALLRLRRFVGSAPVIEAIQPATPLPCTTIYPHRPV